MGPDMVDTLTPTVRRYVKERLQYTYKQSGDSEQMALAAFSLSIDALRATQEPSSVEDCLLWLIRSAQKGNQSAQSLVLRFHTALNRVVPSSIQHEIKSWQIHAAECNYPAAQEDLSSVLTSEECQKVWQRIRTRYANTGLNRFAWLYEDMTSTLEELDRGIRDRMIRSMKSPDFQKQEFDINEHGDNLLHFAASAGLFSVVSLCKDSMPIDINDLGRWEESALLHACRSGHFETAMVLLDSGADPKLQSVAGDTPLHWICSFEGAEAERLASKLVAAGALVNVVAKDHNYQWAPLCSYERGTPLHRAVGKGKVDAIKALLRVGAVANHSGDRPDKKCPIYLASQYYYPDILDLLLQSLRRPSPAAEPYRGFSLLIAAIHGSDLYGLKFSMIARHGKKWELHLQQTVDVLLRHGASDHVHDFPVGFDCAGTTPLQIAIGMGSPEMLAYLLYKGCAEDINRRTFVWYLGVEMLPLVSAIYRTNKEIFDMLLSNGADISQAHYEEDGKKLSHLWQCAFAGHNDTSFARELIARGVEVDERLPGYESAFAAAVRNRCFELAKYLLEEGADPNVEFNEGLFLESSIAATVLEFLIREQTRSALATIDWLLREVPGIKFIVSTTKKHSALHVCASAKVWTKNEAEEGGCKLIADAIMVHFKPTKEQINIQDADGQTALYCATVANNYVMVKILLDAGADPTIENLQGFSAVDANAIFLQMLVEDDNRLVDETDPRSFKRQTKRRMENQEFISNYFAASSTLAT
jgi:ankyrin repeat protein